MSISEKTFIDQFRTSFELYSYGNRQYGTICAHILLGQILRDIRIYFGPSYIDPRISLFLVQPSGTGKSVAWPFIKAVGEASGLKLDDIDEATDAALIGTIEPEEVTDPETKAKETVYNVVKGKLSDVDVLHYDEGQMLIRRGQYSQNSLAWFQKALNPIGSGHNVCVKNLAHGEVKIEPTCSLLITSHEIDNLLDTVLNTGFFQRIVLYPRYVPISERKGNENLRADRFGDEIFTEIDIKTLAEMLFKISKFVHNNYKLKVADGVKSVAKQFIASFYKQIDQSHERVKEIMATFIPRYDNLMYIFALHHSCANFKPEIDIADIKYGGTLTKELFDEALMWVEDNISLSKMSQKEKSYMDRFYQMWYSMEKDDHGYVYYSAFMNNFNAKWNISYKTLTRIITKFIGYGKIKLIEKNKAKMIKIET